MQPVHDGLEVYQVVPLFLNTKVHLVEMNFWNRKHLTKAGVFKRHLVFVGQIHQVWMERFVNVVDKNRVVPRILRGVKTIRVQINQVDVLNGIAYDPVGDRIFVTGKWWPFIFEIDLVNAQ